MAILVKQLHVLNQNSEQEDFEIATTAEETGNTENFMTCMVDGETVYAGLDTDTTVSSFLVQKAGINYAVKHTGTPPYVPGSESYTVAGTYTFTAPYTADYTIEIAGGGGGGGGTCTWTGQSLKSGSSSAYGGTGGNGALETIVASLIAEETYSVVVGAGGSSGSNYSWNERITKVGQYSASAGSGQQGGTSSFDNTTAIGGLGGGGGGLTILAVQLQYYGRAATTGSNGTSYGNGGQGGAGATNGSPGWVTITW